MTATTITHRPAVDIEEDIREFIRSYDPLKQAVHHFSFEADENGKVVLIGNVRSVQAHRVLVDNVPDIPGVTSVDSSAFKDDETLRLEIGRLLPRGAMARVNLGHVILYGSAPQDVEALVNQVKQLTGVRTIDTQF